MNFCCAFRNFRSRKIILDAEPLMTIFKKLISDQLRAENERVQGLRPSTHGYDWKYNKIREIPNF